MSKIIPILKQVIYALENNFTTYDWQKQGHCNCGHVAQIILNKNGSEVGGIFGQEQKKFLSEKIKSKEKVKKKYFFGLFTKEVVEEVHKNIDPTWKNLVQSSCSATGLSGSEIIKAFQTAGFRPEDVVHLEFLENKSILKNSKIDVNTYHHYYTKKSNLIEYLKSWVQILENQDNTSKLNNKEVIERELLIAVSNENFEKAAELRDKLVTL